MIHSEFYHDIYCDRKSKRFSLKKLEGYIGSEDFKKLYDGYTHENINKIVNLSAPTFNYNDWINLLYNKKESDSFEKLVEHSSIFFDGKVPTPKYHISSYQRSGNSMVRKLLENITGICTGSMVSNDNILNL